MRQMLIGSILEPSAFAIRDHLELAKTRWLQPLQFVDVYNNQLARRLLLAITDPNELFLDIGAHIGSVTSAALRRGARVIAFEAIPEKAAKLAEKFPQARVKCVALGEREGQVTFNIDTKASGNSSLAALPNDSLQITVKMMRLDDVLLDESADVIKLDVEGAELGVLRGAGAAIGRSQPTIMFESGPDDRLGYTKPRLWTWLNDHAYEVFCPDRVAHEGASMSLDVFVDSHSYPRRTTNYFAIHPRRLRAVRQRARAYLKF